MSEERITDLEILVAHQGRTIEELSAEVARQGDVMERLSLTLRALQDRFASLEEGMPPVADAPPPHY